MPHSPMDYEQLDRLTSSIASRAAEAEVEFDFPSGPFEALRSGGLLASPPIASEDMSSLLRILMAVGRGDLSTGRIFEGHVNACWLIEQFGSPAQIENCRILLKDGAIFGVWNTDVPSDPLRLEGNTFAGKKNFASGVDGLSHAIVTITNDAGRQMILLPLDGIPVDRSWWRPLGMRASGSHIVDLTGIVHRQDWFLGTADTYVTEPWFSAGAVRFLAVQSGGVHAIFDAAIRHLQGAKRTENPFQLHRIARMAVAVEGCYLWLAHAGRAWQKAARTGEACDADRLNATVNAARLQIEASAMAVLTEAEQAIGAAGFIAPHPFERLMRDLRTYLRQPNPDGAVSALGAAAAAGKWQPGEKFGEQGWR